MATKSLSTSPDGSMCMAAIIFFMAASFSAKNGASACGLAARDVAAPIRAAAISANRERIDVSLPAAMLEVLSGGDDPLDILPLLLGLAGERLDVGDPLTLLAGDLRPIVGIGRVGQVLVLLELLPHCVEEVIDLDALFPGLDVALERQLLGPPHHRLDHRSRREVLEVEDLLVTVGVGDLEEAVLFVEAVHFLHGGRDHPVHRHLDLAAALADLRVVDRQLGGHVLVEDVHRRARIGPPDLDLHVEPAWPQDGRVDQILAVGGADDDDVAQPFHAIELGEELGHDRRLYVGGDAAAARPEEGVHLVEEHHHRDIVGRLLLGLPEDLADLPLRLAHVLVEELRALDVQEVPADLLSALFGDLLREAVGDRFGDHRLAASGRPVEKHALGGRELVLLVIVSVEVRQLDGVRDRLDLGAETADVVVADLGHLFEGEILDLASGQSLEQIARLRVHQDVVARLQSDRPERVGNEADLLRVDAERDESPVLVEPFLEHDNVTLNLVAGCAHDVECFVEKQFLARPQRLDVDRLMERRLQLATLVDDIDRGVLIRRQVDAVGRRRRAELVDLALERADLLTRLAERVQQLLVLIERLDQLMIRLAELVFEIDELGLRGDRFQRRHALAPSNSVGGASRLSTRSSIERATSSGDVGDTMPRWTKSHMIRFPSAQSPPWLGLW